MSSRTHAFFVVVFLTHPPGLLLAAASPLQHRQNGQICCKDSVPASSKDCFKHFQGGTFRKCCRVSAIIVFSWPKATNPIKYWCVSLCDMRGHLVLWFGETPVFNSKLERQWALNSWSLGPIFVLQSGTTGLTIVCGTPPGYTLMKPSTSSSFRESQLSKKWWTRDWLNSRETVSSTHVNWFELINFASFKPVDASIRGLQSRSWPQVLGHGQKSSHGKIPHLWR